MYWELIKMIKLNLKRMYRNKWLLIKMFIISPIIKILPVVLIQNRFSSINDAMLLNLCIWSFFYFSAFESVMMKMRMFSSEKISDIIISRTSIVAYNIYEIIALNIAFLPSYLLTLGLYSFIYNLNFNLLTLLIGSIGTILCNILLMNFVLMLELRFNNYFNKFNVGMDFIYILCGATYPITVLPKSIQFFSRIIPITHLLQYSFSPTGELIIKFLLIYFFALVICIFLLIHQKNIFIERGGRG